MDHVKNAGKPWTPGEEAELLRAFEAGTRIHDLARQHGRTPQAIHGRLYRLGKMPPWQRTAPLGDLAAGIGGRQKAEDKGISTPAFPAQIRLDGLNAAARGLAEAGFSPDELPTILRAEIKNLQRETGQKLTLRDGRTDGVWFKLTARRPCINAHVRKPNQVRFLSGKIAGVWIVVSLHKPGMYRHENAHVAQALRTLALAIERVGVPLADYDMELRVEG
jgi:hypothetical protein